jgi:hypothetical protein
MVRTLGRTALVGRGAASDRDGIERRRCRAEMPRRFQLRC